MAVVTQDQVVLWVQESGSGTNFIPFASGEKAASMTGKSVPLISAAPQFVRDNFGRPQLLTIEETPGELATATVTIYDRHTLTFLEKMTQNLCPINFQIRKTNCGVLDNPNGWTKLTHWARGQLTTFTPGDGPSLLFDGTTMQSSGSLVFRSFAVLVKTSLSALTTTETQAILDIAGIPDAQCDDCGGGYPGADKILFAGAAAAGGATANLLYSNDGGSSWAAATTDPFATDEDINFVVVRSIGASTGRVIVGTKDAAKVAWSDFEFGDEGNLTWTTVTPAAPLEALEWPSYDRLYIAAAGDIYVSTDQGESFGTALYSDAVVLNGFSRSPDGQYVYAFGATNAILRETEANGVFVVRTGPSGGGTFHSMHISAEGTIFAGNGTAVYKNTDNANVAGNWELLKDFGANHRVVAIDCVRDEAELIRVVVDDTTPGTGTVFESVDGGANFREITELTNTGYNAAYFSETDNNLATVVGDASGGLGVLHRLAP